jgi:hypothetical protein
VRARRAKSFWQELGRTLGSAAARKRWSSLDLVPRHGHANPMFAVVYSMTAIKGLQDVYGFRIQSRELSTPAPTCAKESRQAPDEAIISSKLYGNSTTFPAKVRP